jgi:hypothetical protein
MCSDRFYQDIPSQSCLRCCSPTWERHQGSIHKCWWRRRTSSRRPHSLASLANPSGTGLNLVDRISECHMTSRNEWLVFTASRPPDSAWTHSWRRSEDQREPCSCWSLCTSALSPWCSWRVSNSKNKWYSLSLPAYRSCQSAILRFRLSSFLHSLSMSWDRAQRLRKCNSWNDKLVENASWLLEAGSLLASFSFAFRIVYLRQVHVSWQSLLLCQIQLQRGPSNQFWLTVRYPWADPIGLNRIYFKYRLQIQW